MPSHNRKNKPLKKAMRVAKAQKKAEQAAKKAKEDRRLQPYEAMVTQVKAMPDAGQPKVLRIGVLLEHVLEGNSDEGLHGEQIRTCELWEMLTNANIRGLTEMQYNIVMHWILADYLRKVGEQFLGKKTSEDFEYDGIGDDLARLQQRLFTADFQCIRDRAQSCQTASLISASHIDQPFQLLGVLRGAPNQVDFDGKSGRFLVQTLGQDGSRQARYLYVEEPKQSSRTWKGRLLGDLPSSDEIEELLALPLESADIRSLDVMAEHFACSYDLWRDVAKLLHELGVEHSQKGPQTSGTSSDGKTAAIDSPSPSSPSLKANAIDNDERLPMTSLARTKMSFAAQGHIIGGGIITPALEYDLLGAQNRRKSYFVARNHGQLETQRERGRELLMHCFKIPVMIIWIERLSADWTKWIMEHGQQNHYFMRSSYKSSQLAIAEYESSYLLAPCKDEAERRCNKHDEERTALDYMLIGHSQAADEMHQVGQKHRSMWRQETEGLKKKIAGLEELLKKHGINPEVEAEDDAEDYLDGIRKDN
ncbi:MAG: hypothetical protein M1820_001646 [Bogoriella megaspora]|nr:MAG: hypothetical protein M1820_001646 [Bogoriella megaspora]